MLVCTFLKFSISMSISHSHERSFIGHIRDQIEILTDKINFRKYIILIIKISLQNRKILIHI